MVDRPYAGDEITLGADDSRQIAALVAGLADGFNRKDADVLDRQVAADAVMVAPDGTLLRGWDDLYAYHSARLAGPVVEWHTAFTILSVTPLSPDVAVVHTRQDTTTPDGGLSNHGTCVVTRRDGAWWIAAMHSTNLAAPQPPDAS